MNIIPINKNDRKSLSNIDKNKRYAIFFSAFKMHFLSLSLGLRNKNNNSSYSNKIHFFLFKVSFVE